MKPKVSIIIPFYNCSFVAEAIDSALKQSYPNKEVIVVNDGSTRYLEKLHPFLDKIQLIEKDNGGTASALNTGIKQAKGEYIAWLSSDDIYLPEKINIQIDWMEKHGYKISFTPFYIVDENKNILYEPIKIKFHSQTQLKKILRKKNLFNGSTAIIHQDVFSKVGLFNENLLYTQDYEFWLRASKYFSIGIVERPTILYRMHEEMGSKKYAAEVQEELNVMKQNYIY